MVDCCGLSMSSVGLQVAALKAKLLKKRLQDQRVRSDERAHQAHTERLKHQHDTLRHAVAQQKHHQATLERKRSEKQLSDMLGELERRTKHYTRRKEQEAAQAAAREPPELAAMRGMQEVV